MKAKVKRNNKYVFRVVLAVWIMMAVVLTAFMPDTVRAEASETEKLMQQFMIMTIIKVIMQICKKHLETSVKAMWIIL